MLSFPPFLQLSWPKAPPIITQSIGHNFINREQLGIAYREVHLGTGNVNLIVDNHHLVHTVIEQ